jgi:hypothetical protein
MSVHLRVSLVQLGTGPESEFVTSNDKPRIVTYRYNIEANIEKKRLRIVRRPFLIPHTVKDNQPMPFFGTLEASIDVSLRHAQAVALCKP